MSVGDRIDDVVQELPLGPQVSDGVAGAGEWIAGGLKLGMAGITAAYKGYGIATGASDYARFNTARDAPVATDRMLELMQQKLPNVLMLENFPQKLNYRSPQVQYE